MKKRQLVKTICETMATIALKAEDTMFNEFSGGPSPATVCEDLAHQLGELGVHGVLIEEFFELSKASSLNEWIKSCVHSVVEEGV